MAIVHAQGPANVHHLIEDGTIKNKNISSDAQITVNKMDQSFNDKWTDLTDGGTTTLHSHSGGGGGVSDHGDLTGLGDDDHTQYLLASSATSRANFASGWTDLTDGGATTLHTHASIPSTLDDLSDVSAASPNNRDLIYYDSDTGTWLTAATAFLSGAAQSYYYNITDASDIGGYKIASAIPSTNSEATDVYSNTGTESFTLRASFATPLTFPGVTVIPVGMYWAHIHAKTDGAAALARIKVEVYSRTSGGTETLLTTITSASFGGTTAQEILFNSTIDLPVTVAITDRLVFKVYTARVSGGSGSVETTLYFEGTTRVSFSLTSIPGVAPALIDHGLLSGLADDDHSAYLLASDATNRATFASGWTDLTDGGETSLHSHAAIADDSPSTNMDSYADAQLSTQPWEHIFEHPLGFWSADAPPDNPTATDDEFADNSGAVPVGWTEMDHGGTLTPTEEAYGLSLLQTNHGNQVTEIAGLYKTIPAGDFTIYCKISLTQTLNVNYPVAGLCVFQDASSSTGDIVGIFFYGNNSPEEIVVNSYTAYNSSATGLIGGLPPNTGTDGINFYLRIRRNSTTYSFDLSRDGITWKQMYSSTISFTPTHFGPVISNQTASITTRAVVSFFRYIASDVGSTGIVGGRRI